MQENECDFKLVSGFGSFDQLCPVTENAREWLSEHMDLEGWEFLGSFLCIPSGSADEIIYHIQQDGLTIN